MDGQHCLQPLWNSISSQGVAGTSTRQSEKAKGQYIQTQNIVHHLLETSSWTVIHKFKRHTAKRHRAGSPKICSCEMSVYKASDESSGKNSLQNKEHRQKDPFIAIRWGYLSLCRSAYWTPKIRTEYENWIFATFWNFEFKEHVL